MYCSLHYFITKNIDIDDANTTITCYREKTKQTIETNPYEKYTEAYLKCKGKNTVLPGKRSLTLPNKATKLKEQLKELTHLLTNSSQTLTNNFAQAHIVKTIWCSAYLLLAILQDATCVWLYVNPITCNLVKILIDKTLSSGLKLSGKCVCDVQIVYKTTDKHESYPFLVIVYSDKFKIDFVNFTKHFQLKKHLDNSNEKLEKLSQFEPVLVSFDIDAQPSINRIDKYIHVDTRKSTTVTVWWKNDGQIIWTPIEKSINLLKDSNIIVFNIETAQQPFVEFKIKSQSGQLISLFYQNEKSLIAIEQTELKIRSFQIDVYRYDLNQGSHQPQFTSSTLSFGSSNKNYTKIKLCTFNIDTKIDKLSQCLNTNNFIVLITHDLNLYVYNLNSNIINKFKNQHEIQTPISLMNSYYQIEWLIEDLLFFVYDSNGMLLSLFDMAFNKIDLYFEKRDLKQFKLITTSKETNLLHSLTTHRCTHADLINVCFYFQNGTCGLIQVKLPHNFNEISLITMFLKNSTIKNAIFLLNTFNWDLNGRVCMIGFYKIINYLFNLTDALSVENQAYIEQTLSCFYKPQKQLNENTINCYKYTITRYVRRYFYKLIRNGLYDKAYLLAIDIGALDLFNDLYYCALNKKFMQLAEICRKKFIELDANVGRKKIGSSSSSHHVNNEEIYFISSRHPRHDAVDVVSTDDYNTDNMYVRSDEDFFTEDVDDDAISSGDDGSAHSSEDNSYQRAINDFICVDSASATGFDKKVKVDKINFNSTFKSIDQDFQKFKSIFKFDEKLISNHSTIKFN